MPKYNIYKTILVIISLFVFLFIYPSGKQAQANDEELTEEELLELLNADQIDPSLLAPFDDDFAIEEPTDARGLNEEFYRAEVISIILEEDIQVGGITRGSQTVKIRILNGPYAGEEFEIEHISTTNSEREKMKEGETIVVVKVDGVSGTGVFIIEKYRLPLLALLLGIFFILTIFLAGIRGFTALFGLVVSISIIAGFIVPQILAGRNPMLIAFIGSVVIAVISIYLAHGVSRRTTIALVSTLISIAIAMIVAVIFVSVGRILGIGSDEAFYVQVSLLGDVDLRGLLLGGIIIGALGVLDDITTSQAATVDELYRANPSLSTKELYTRGISVGREHITSLVNTLVLAYVGASMPLLLIFTITNRPWWVTMNSEVIAEEIVRTLVGSITLIIAVPITTYLAAYFIPKAPPDPHAKRGHVHHH